MRYTFNTILAFLVLGVVCAQNKKSKGDDYFFAYAYKDAIVAYQDDIEKGFELSDEQQLNLADAYFQTADFEQALGIYSHYFSQDTIVDNFRLNRYLVSLKRLDKKERLNAIVTQKGTMLGNELLENADFNTSIMHADTEIPSLDFEVFNLESNSPKADFSPSFFEERLLFTSGRSLEGDDRKDAGGYLEIFSATLLGNGQVSDVARYQAINPSEYHKATPYFSKQLNSIFYVLSNTLEGELEFDENGKNALAIGVQKLEGNFRFLWRDLSTSFYYPFYDERTERLYFAARLEDSFGGTDIYYVNTNKGNIMSAPINLGPRVNSPGNEIAPYIFENSLYFSSDIFYGYGGMDIYKTNILGADINSDADDFGFVIRNKDEGLLGYFSSNRQGGKGEDDVYGFIVDEKPGIKTIVLKGQVVTGRYNETLANATVTLKNKDGSVLKEVVSGQDGNYRIEVPWQEEVILEVSKEKYSIFSQSYAASAVESLEQMDANVSLVSYDDIVEEKEGQIVLKINKFFFAKGSTTINKEIAKELDKVVQAIKLFPKIQLRIETYTDSRGGGATNFTLTQKRSDGIKKYLLKQGVSNSNILFSVGYGEQKILNNCANGVYCLEVLHKRNQRSLFVVLNDNVMFN